MFYGNGSIDLRVLLFEYNIGSGFGGVFGTSVNVPTLTSRNFGIIDVFFLISLTLLSFLEIIKPQL